MNPSFMIYGGAFRPQIVKVGALSAPTQEMLLNLHARTLGTTINETVQTAGVESILAIIYTVANGKDRVYFGPAAR